jgi:energy-coupling factor transport system substrate-specific component
MSWQLTSFVALAAVLAAGFGWYERTRPSSRIVALVAALAALAVAGRLVLAPVPNVVATTDIALITGYALGAAPGFAVGALAAPISNIWLGQGPWTVWQMGGWGLAGLAGAGLAAVFGRRLGRLSLALACAGMAFVYGALLDLSVMVTYGGEQSLDRYLALSARGIPFNVAHALGNFTIALAAGPALVRMIERYRARLDFRWHPAGALPAALAALAVAVAVAAPPPAAGAGTASARAWLEHARESSGGYAATPGSRPSPQMTGWAMLGLEAAGRNPLDVGANRRTPVDYLSRHEEAIRQPNELELAILGLEAAGKNSRRFAGRDLASELARAQGGDGSWGNQVNLTAYAVLALRAAGMRAGVADAAGWLRGAQNADGGWGFGPSQPSDPDSTGAAIQGLAAAGAGGLDGGIAYLRETQRREGGWGLNETGVTNSQSTAWAVQGLVAAGVDPQQVQRRGRSGLDYLAARQRSDGSYSYNAESSQTPVWVTAQALLAVSREALPVETVPRSEGGHAPEPAPDVAPGAEPPASTAPAGQQQSADTGTNDGGRQRDHAQGREREQGGLGERSERSARDEAPAAAEVLAEQAGETDAAPEEDDGDSTAAIVGAGLGGLALALAAGWFWYRRTLP